MTAVTPQKPEMFIKISSSPEDSFDSFRFHDHQARSITAMTKHFESETKGVLVIPTGGGKTETGTRWVLRNHVSKGGRVLWLAHRRSLLMQAFQTFHRAARDAAIDHELPRETLGLIRVSGQDGFWSQVSSEHDVVFATLNSSSTAANLGFVTAMADQSEHPLFVIIDEAHHVAAPGYQRILKALEPYNFRLLGLTATPVRMDERDNRKLWNSLGKIIYKVDKAELIEKEILSVPHSIPVETEIDFEKDLTTEDLAHLDRYGDLGPQMLERISKHSHRNELIVQHYVEKREKYGKTMVFAANVAHAITLNEEFTKHGVSCDYVADQKGDSYEVMEAFRKGTGSDVLVSVEMLTEGYDAPGTQSIFLARPTQSESLFSQMIGRALRGPAAGGTKEAYLVYFVDSWNKFEVLDPEYLVAPGSVDELEPTKAARQELIPIEIALILEAYRLLQSNIASSSMTVFEFLPGAWYIWEEEFEDDIQTRRVLIFDHQMPFLEDLREGDYNLPDAADEQTDYLKSLYETLFADCPDPRPRMSDVRNLLEAKKKGIQVHSYTFKEKEEFSAARIGRQLYDEDVVPKKQRGRIQEIFDGSAICQAVYRNDFNRFHEDVKRELQEVDHVRSDGSLPEVIEPKAPENRAAAWPEGHAGYDLYKIMREQMAFFPKGLDINEISWTKRPIKGYWGQYRYKDKHIIANHLLNSPAIPLFVVEFLVYHELLHADMPGQNHSPSFRERERNFTPSRAAIEDAAKFGYQESKMSNYWRIVSDQFLDTYHRKYLTQDGKMQK